MNFNKRTIPGSGVVDPGSISSIQYNDAAGSKKVSEVGKHLLPIPVVSAGVLSYVTTVTGTPIPLPRMGMNLAVYNNDTAIHAITLGESATSPAAALAVGITDANGHVGIPCPPAAWTYIATSSQQWVVADNSKLLIFLIDDNSQIVNTLPAQVGAPSVY